MKSALSEMAQYWLQRTDNEFLYTFRLTPSRVTWQLAQYWCNRYRTLNEFKNWVLVDCPKTSFRNMRWMVRTHTFLIAFKRSMVWRCTEGGVEADGKKEAALRQFQDLLKLPGSKDNYGEKKFNYIWPGFDRDVHVWGVTWKIARDLYSKQSVNHVSGSAHG